MTTTGRWRVGNALSPQDHPGCKCNRPWPVRDENGDLLRSAKGRPRWFGSPEAAQRAADAENAMERLAQIAERLRETADGLRTWNSGEGRAPAINPHHAANRMDKLADEINGGSR